MQMKNPFDLPLPEHHQGQAGNPVPEIVGAGSANPFDISMTNPFDILMANPEVVKPAPNPFDFQSNSVVQSTAPPSIGEVLATRPVFPVRMFIPTELRANRCA
jgi:hypothetical protein